MTFTRLRACGLRILCCVSLSFASLGSLITAQVQPGRPGISVAPIPTWSPLQPRQFSAVAHDSLHNQFFLFGGTYGSQRFDDTWLLGASGWTIQNPPLHPAARISSAAAYDEVRHEAVLFGGRVKEALLPMCTPGQAAQGLKSEYFCRDTWTYNGHTWLKKFSAFSPTAREGHAMAFDAMRGQVVLFGGTAGGTGSFNDTWIWDGNSWKQAFPAHQPPSRFWHAMAYDPVHRQVVLFGGSNGRQIFNDTWLWNGKDWQEAGYQPTPPELRTNAAMDFDPTTSKMVLFSGTAWSSSRSGAVSLDSWSWDGTHWKKLPAANFQILTDFSKLTAAQLKTAIVANGTPSYIWIPIKK